MYYLKQVKRWVWSEKLNFKKFSDHKVGLGVHLFPVTSTSPCATYSWAKSVGL